MKTIMLSLLAVLVTGGAVGAAEDVAQLKALTARQWTVPKLDLKMVRIEAGTFVMGSPETEPERREDETRHKVTISRPFYMGVHEVTQKQYYDVMLPNFRPPDIPF